MSLESVFYLVAIIVYSLFIIRFILSWVGADFEFDMDTDLDMSDVVSFKGITHFLMGSSGWLALKSYLFHNIQWYDYLTAFVLGCIFVVILFYVYKFLMKLESKPHYITGKEQIGHTGIVYLKLSNDTYSIFVNNGVDRIQVDAMCMEENKSYKVGDVVQIKDYSNGYYII